MCVWIPMYSFLILLALQENIVSVMKACFRISSLKIKESTLNWHSKLHIFSCEKFCKLQLSSCDKFTQYNFSGFGLLKLTRLREWMCPFCLPNWFLFWGLLHWRRIRDRQKQPNGAKFYIKPHLIFFYFIYEDYFCCN